MASMLAGNTICLMLEGCSGSQKLSSAGERAISKPASSQITSKQDSAEVPHPDPPHSQFGSLGGSLLSGFNSTKPPKEASGKAQVVSPPTLTPKTLATCSGPKIGLYSWDQSSWKSKDSALIKHLSGSNARSTTCGDVYINVADYSNPHKIYHSDSLIPFIKNVRRVGNQGVVYLTYGDVETKNSTACRMFIDTFFNWYQSVSSTDMKEMQPIGVSFDIEHFPIGHTERLLKYAQEKKKAIGAKNVLIQWTIEGRVNPVDTEAVMRYADSALMMAYRNYMSRPGDLDGSKNGLLRRMQYMLKEQCVKCLDDAHASKYYTAKITIMVETACNVGEYCDRVSFCAVDKGPGFVVSTLDKLKDAMLTTGLITTKQRDRLFNVNSMFSVHHWEWFQCFYRDRNDTNKLCASYRAAVTACQKESV